MEKTTMIECTECDGDGKVLVHSIGLKETYPKTCSMCNGKGEIDEELKKIKKWKEGSVEKCPYCGSGALAEISSYKGETWNYLCEDCDRSIHIRNLPKK